MSAARRGVALLAAVVLAGAGLAACGGSSGGDAAVPEATIPVSSSTGDSCTDATGDLDLPAGVPASTPGLSGIDIVKASATVDGDQLDVSMTMAGPVDAAPSATYVVAQGDPLGALSFELRMVHGTDGWTTTLITWPEAKETRTTVAVTPVVAGDTLTATVPLQGLPPIALALQFGTSAQACLLYTSDAADD